MTIEEIIDFLEMKSQLEPENEDIFNNIVKVLEPCEDAVSRSEVARIINKQRFGIHKISMGIIKEKIENLPPVTPAICIAKINYSKDDMQKLVNEKIKEITAGLEESKWIPVKERLPENTDYYLIQYSRKTCPDENAVAFYSVEEKESDPDYEWEFTPQCGEYKEVLAWMPLPELYKPEKESEE